MFGTWTNGSTLIPTISTKFKSNVDIKEYECLFTSGHHSNKGQSTLTIFAHETILPLYLKLHSLFAAWLFWTVHTKSHNMKALVILSHNHHLLGPMTPYTASNIANIHNIDLIHATPLNIFWLLWIPFTRLNICQPPLPSTHS